ncbi:tetratricopeptide repeat protein SKI3 isoform X1 [Elaeis guineensis]|uniref:Tetratricopeptide repeat protein SKI3 isoform X2 n=2 Tax=Elaeis guineensis var. tenera TaxID=51953 RepID=A0A6I9RUL8_ELAGV|nr:tetratricopeptide repeat protein SKI3 isoform X2 [Elaeis guineensis]
MEEHLFRQLQQTLNADPNNPTHHYNLGLLLWERGEGIDGEESKKNKEKAAEHFLACAKLKPSEGAAFRFLGHYYSQVSDAQRASKCYQRAVILNPDDFEAGEGLCDLLDAEGKESLEIAFCKEASGKSPRAFWAYRRLGYLQVHQKKWSEAVQCLQHAIRGYPACADLWEALGLAYQRLGMFTAAIKSYGRAIELEDSRIFALIESGNIQLMLGSFRKGVEQFRHALEMTPHNVSAHFGLASGLLAWSKDCIKSGAFGWGASLLLEASEVAEVSTRLSDNISSSWKLHGDVQITYAKCFPWEDRGNGSEFDAAAFTASINDWKKTCLLAANAAKQSYQRALHLSPWQTNMYADIAIAVDLISSLEEKDTPDMDVWQLAERMSLGALILEGDNKDFWVILGCLSTSRALKQHAFIRGLQLDMSLSVAWAYLGKLYRNLGEKQLARQAFDHARSIDPSLALPWAGISVDSHDSSQSEAYENCLRAVQILPLPEFQVGLGALAIPSGQLLSPQAFGAIRQAIQRAPYSAEAHNLHGLLCEARSDYQSAITAYQQARCALHMEHNSVADLKSHIAEVSVNLARALIKAGHANNAVEVCDYLKKEGVLDGKGLQIYAVALWKIGQYDLALPMARNLAQSVSTMKQTCAAAALGLICSLIYRISGKDSAVAAIQKFPPELFKSTRMMFMLSALNALDPSNQLQLLLPSPQNVKSHDVVTEIYSIIAIGKMINHGSKQNLDIDRGVDYLRKALHMYPNSSLIRSQLSSLLLCSGDWMASHKAARCTATPTGHIVKKELESSYKIHGDAVVACYASCSNNPKFSFPTCKDQLAHGANGIHYMQRWLHQEPWNLDAHYLLVLNVLQKAREEKFPQHLCSTLKRLLLVALSKEIYMKENKPYQYQKFVLLLCASEISLQCGDHHGCVKHATGALGILPPNSDPFFAHLQLCRAYAAEEDFSNLRNEYMNCLQIKTFNQIGWISLKYIESRYKLQNNSNEIDMYFHTCSTGKGASSNIWEAVFYLVCAQSFIWDRDYLGAEQALAHACALGVAESCLFLFHGAVCMELARQQPGRQFLSHAVSSLTKAQENSPVPLPIVSLLLAQAEASLGAKAKWERNLRVEWFSWPAEMMPAELYFQMHLLARRLNASSSKHSGIESMQSPKNWVLRAIHLNPSCLRYWKILQKLSEG